MNNKGINDRIIKIWKEFYKEKKTHTPFLFPKLKKNCLLFVGCNPSFSNNIFKKIFKGSNFEGEDPKKLFLWENNRMRNLTIQKSIYIDHDLAFGKCDYFRKMKEIAKENKCGWEHIDLFFVRKTNQKEFKKIIEYKNKLNNFGEKQLQVSIDLIKRIRPKVIIVANAYASNILKERFDSDLKFDNNFGFYFLKINNRKIPIFFSSMMSGQRALDNGSYERLKWHINQAL